MTELEIAAYLDHGLSGDDRDRIENHLAHCADCRESVVDAQLLMEKVKTPRNIFIGMATAAVAAAALLLLWVPTRTSNVVSTAPLRGATAGAVRIVAYAPTGEVKLGAVRFVWAAVDGAMTYRISVSRADASPVWSGSVTDTVANLPGSIRLQPGERYYWVADALLSDGSTRSTGLREFGPVR